MKKGTMKLTGVSISLDYAKKKNGKSNLVLVAVLVLESKGLYSLRGRRSKGKGKGIRARDHARGRRGEVPFLSPSRAPRALARPNSPFPFPF